MIYALAICGYIYPLKTNCESTFLQAFSAWVMANKQTSYSEIAHQN